MGNFKDVRMIRGGGGAKNFGDVVYGWPRYLNAVEPSHAVVSCI